MNSDTTNVNSDFVEFTTPLDIIVDNMMNEVLNEQLDNFDRLLNTIKQRKERLVLNQLKCIVKYIKDKAISNTKIISDISRKYGVKIQTKEIDRLKKLDFTSKDIDRTFSLLYKWYKQTKLGEIDNILLNSK
ncbi:unnamed protein product [Brachionus calyciflorus]|uniref:Uncharacterized protein n=1 Tax=Brachionus calyciflorus TaxID=104777 RepID=A0A814EKG6_9BILA|nr:unnamed protein product [Brachionus calyciflorus]